jgi:hypothetical protein
MIIIIVAAGSIRALTQGFVFARQVLHHCAQNPSPFFCGGWGRESQGKEWGVMGEEPSCFFCLGPTSDKILLHKLPI